jgi:hypothetical protein
MNIATVGTNNSRTKFDTSLILSYGGIIILGVKSTIFRVATSHILTSLGTLDK